MRWLHLSDFHTGKDHYGQRRLYTEIIEHIRHRVEGGSGPDCVFLTGDLANRGRSDEYELFVEEFLIPLSDLFGSEGLTRVFAIPGNHDVDRTAAEFIEAHSLLRRAPKLFDPDHGGASQRRNLLPRFDGFRTWDLTCPGTHWLESEQGTFSHILTLQDQNVGIVGLNTAWLSENDEDRHRLTPGIPLLEEALSHVSTCQVKIVLGHHPIDWFADEEVRPIEAILARHQSIYLHGHLHNSRARHESGAGRSFLALQSGAAFQARDSERWVNGFMWASLDMERRIVRAEPLNWSRNHREWAIDGTAFPSAWLSSTAGEWHVPLPTLEPARRTAPAAAVSNPPQHSLSVELGEGWQCIEKSSLEARKQPIPPEEMVRFFDGRVPRWAIALSPDVPRREIVEELTSSVVEGQGTGSIRMILLLAAGGEGKSTALLQSAAASLEAGAVTALIWHHDTQTRLRVDDLLRLPRRPNGWLIVSDDADLIVADLLRAAEALQAAERSDIHFLLCSRDTDWKAARGEQLPWARTVDYDIHRLRGLSVEDADAVVEAWTRFGHQGLGRLAGTTHDEAVQALLEAAASESGEAEGAFLGAMLRVRVGTDMREHVRALLERLGSRPAPGGDLLGAFAYIALAHTEDLALLSSPVLAHMLGCSSAEIRRKIMNPLGEEAAAVSAGQILLTRHKAIAETSIELLEESFGLDREQALVQMVEAANRAANDGEFVFARGEWEYLGKRYFDKGDQILGFRMAQAVMDLNRDNPRFRTHYGHLFRLAEQPDKAAEVFRGGAMLRQRPRGYYAEWGISEHLSLRSACGAWLLAASLFDRTELKPPDVPQARISLGRLATVFDHLFEAYRDPAYNTASQACGTAVQRYLGSRPIRIEQEGESVEDSQSLVTVLSGAAHRAWEQRETELPDWTLGPDALSLTALEQLLRNSGFRRNTTGFSRS